MIEPQAIAHLRDMLDRGAGITVDQAKAISTAIRVLERRVDKSPKELDAYTFNDRGIRMLVATYGLCCFSVRVDNPEIDDHTFINESIRRFRDGIAALELGEVGEYKTKLRSVVSDAPGEGGGHEPHQVLEHNHPPETPCVPGCPVYSATPMFPLPGMDT